MFKVKIKELLIKNLKIKKLKCKPYKLRLVVLLYYKNARTFKKL